MRTIQREIVSALIFSQDGKLFMGMKDPKKGGVYRDSWHIPGGGIDKDETHKEALIREILEETGINITKEKIELVDDKGSGESIKIVDDEKVLVKMKFNIYKVQLELISTEIQVSLNDDLVKYDWFDISGLKDVKLTPPSMNLFNKLGYISL